MNTTDLTDFYAGDYVTFKVSTNYDNSYTCKVVFIGEKKNFTFSATSYDNGFIFNLNPEETTLFDKGYYKLFTVFERINYKKTEELSKVNILDNILNSNCVDIISYNRKMLTAIEDILANRMKDDYDSYTIGNRSITKMKPESLLKLRDYFQEKVALEDSYQNGSNKGNKLKIRWVGRYHD